MTRPRKELASIEAPYILRYIPLRTQSVSRGRLSGVLIFAVLIIAPENTRTPMPIKLRSREVKAQWYAGFTPSPACGRGLGRGQSKVN